MVSEVPSIILGFIDSGPVVAQNIMMARAHGRGYSPHSREEQRGTQNKTEPPRTHPSDLLPPGRPQLLKFLKIFQNDTNWGPITQYIA
jgi:hypothetical protein